MYQLSSSHLFHQIWRMLVDLHPTAMRSYTQLFHWNSAYGCKASCVMFEDRNWSLVSFHQEWLQLLMSTGQLLGLAPTRPHKHFRVVQCLLWVQVLLYFMELVLIPYLRHLLDISWEVMAFHLFHELGWLHNWHFEWTKVAKCIAWSSNWISLSS